MVTSSQLELVQVGNVTEGLFPVSDLQSRLDAVEEALNSSTASQQLSLVQGHFISLTQLPMYIS